MGKHREPQAFDRVERQATRTPALAVPADPGNGQTLPGAPEEEVTAGAEPYLVTLGRIHERLQPDHYLEIGVRQGHSLRLARGSAIGIDPGMRLDGPMPEAARLFHETSDEFFERNAAKALGNRRVDLAFIDGLHLFEYALRDFINLERWASPCGLIVVDDIFPNHVAQGHRHRRTRVWTGDVWRFLNCLSEQRPDLVLLPLDCEPTGLLLIAGLDPTNPGFQERYHPIIRRYLPGETSEPPPALIRRDGALNPTDPLVNDLLDGLRQRGRAGAEGGSVRPFLEEVRGRCRHRSATDSRQIPPVTFPRREPLLSIVVIAYNMPREVPRTLLSLSPSLQVGVSGDEYEVILVENGSTQLSDLDACQSRGLNLRVETLMPGHPSPCRAINHGLALARGELCGVMIDGARMASPGLVAGALRARRLHHRPVISTLGFHLGPDIQPRSVPLGYDQRVEDRLLDEADWTCDGYRLFAISVLACSSSRGWFAPMSESNALFMTKALWSELGGFEERFQLPGGGLVNLDTYVRACSLPDSQLITLLGEGTFHQVHGGVATNAKVHPEAAFHEEFMAIRGHPFAPPTTLPLLLGTVNHQVLPSIARSTGQSANLARSVG